MNTQEAIEILERDLGDMPDCDSKEALTHAIESMKRFQWQSIETAPKEEVRFLCRKKNGGSIFEAYFVWEIAETDDGAEYVDWVLVDDNRDDWVDDDDYSGYEWMPLPEPPQEGETK